ncbi:zinc finger protein GLIS2 [Platysternon megacephalum]|uniref:Zinc finger protein GLIS2 n=1 Tax=Platysternon megacephalum TaxID=55544 RepID=A0A4D9ED65_9SAUR|nr:zinc finger protein GLIS2 [Platysternon megacephalum]
MDQSFPCPALCPLLPQHLYHGSQPLNSKGIMGKNKLGDACSVKQCIQEPYIFIKNKAKLLQTMCISYCSSGATVSYLLTFPVQSQWSISIAVHQHDVRSLVKQPLPASMLFVQTLIPRKAGWTHF